MQQATAVAENKPEKDRCDFDRGGKWGAVDADYRRDLSKLACWIVVSQVIFWQWIDSQPAPSIQFVHILSHDKNWDSFCSCLVKCFFTSGWNVFLISVHILLSFIKNTKHSSIAYSIGVVILLTFVDNRITFILCQSQVMTNNTGQNFS